jgi:hypothetical protein
VPASIKLKEEYGDDLAVIFVEVQGADAETAEAFAWRQKWMGAGAMWTTERPLTVEGNTIPQFALLDVDGNVLLEGNPLEQKKQIEEAIAEQVKKAKAPPADAPPQLAKPWAAFAKGDVAGALAALDKLAAEPELAEAAAAARADMEARTAARIARGTWMIDNGFLGEAAEHLEPLAKSVKGVPELEEAVAAELARAKTPGPELDAAAALASVLAKMKKDKPFDDKHVKALGKLAEKHAGTKAAARAQHLVALAQQKG